MKRSVILALLGGVLLLTGGCTGRQITGSGKPVTRDLNLSGFSRIEAGSAFVLEIVQADAFRTSVTADDNLFNYLEAGQSGGTLTLRLKPGYSYIRTSLRAQITMPRLDALQLSGASKATLLGFQGAANMNLALSGASALIGSIEATAVRLDLSGASNSTLRGSATSLDLSESGASRAALLEFPVQACTANLSGASSAAASVSERLDADLSGASTLEYSGNPTLGKTSTSGGSTLKKR
jgi:hypothetical protein